MSKDYEQITPGQMLWDKIETAQSDSYISDACREMSEDQLKTVCMAAVRAHKKSIEVLLEFMHDELQMTKNKEVVIIRFLDMASNIVKDFVMGSPEQPKKVKRLNR